MNLQETKFKLNRDIPIPLFFQVKRIILNELAAGGLKQGDKLPGEAEFCECLMVSRPTVRQALNELVSEGVLIRSKKSGTFVAEPKISLPVSLGIENLRRYLENSSRECEITVLDLCVVDGIEEINQKLKLDSNESLIYLKRIWRIGDIPFVYSATYLSFSRFAGLLNMNFSQLSLFELLSIHFHVQIEKRTTKFEATLASKFDLELLEINRTRAPLLCITDISVDNTSTPVCYSVSRYRGDKWFISDNA